MKKQLKRFWLLALLLGSLITLISTTQSTWKQQGDCWRYRINNIKTDIHRVDCSSREYGLPLRFVTSDPRVDVSVNTTLPDDSNAPVFLGISSRTVLSLPKLAVDVAFWSLITLAVLSLVASQKKPKKSA